MFSTLCIECMCVSAKLSHLRIIIYMANYWCRLFIHAVWQQLSQILDSNFSPDLPGVWTWDLILHAIVRLHDNVSEALKMCYTKADYDFKDIPNGHQIAFYNLLLAFPHRFNLSFICPSRGFCLYQGRVLQRDRQENCCHRVEKNVTLSWDRISWNPFEVAPLSREAWGAMRKNGWDYLEEL